MDASSKEKYKELVKCLQRELEEEPVSPVKVKEILVKLLSLQGELEEEPVSLYRHPELKERFQRERLQRESESQNNLYLRLYRSISWLSQAERELFHTRNKDASFIFYWIAFNALYGEVNIEGDDVRDKELRRDYFDKLIKLDLKKKIYNTLCKKFSKIEDFLSNEFVYWPFWQYHRGKEDCSNWEKRLNTEKQRVKKALQKPDTLFVLEKIFDRMYLLRNQILHGAATWDSNLNRGQVSDGTAIMSSLLPIFIELMMDHPQKSWGMLRYPPLT